IQNCTITNNSTSDMGGGLDTAATSNPVTIKSTIIAGNSGDNASPDLHGKVSAFNCDFGNTSGAAISGAGNLFNTDPQLLPLANNGGPTSTHALKATSPAIDAGSNPTGALYDQRGVGFPRTNSTVTDIGAYEAPRYKPTATTSTVDVNNPGGSVY